MIRSHEQLHRFGQHLIWSIQGAAIALSAVYLWGGPRQVAVPVPVTVSPPAVHVHVAPEAPAVTTAAATGPARPTPTMAELPPPLPLDDRRQAVCAVIDRFGGIYADPLRPVVYVDRVMVNAFLENQAIARRPPYVLEERDGRPFGIRLTTLKSPTSMLLRLGFQSGDVVHSINGHEFAIAEQALASYAHLRSADVLSVFVERRGAPLMLEFRIC